MPLFVIFIEGLMNLFILTKYIHTHTHTPPKKSGEAMPLITHLGLKQEANYFGHAAPFHCFKGEYKGHQVAIVTNGKDPTFGCDNVRMLVLDCGWAGECKINSHTL